MKLIIVALAFVASLPTASAWESTYDALLQKYVKGRGVRYAAWHGNASDRSALSSVVSAIGSASIAGKTRDEKLAFYLNAYNANILDKILADYPTGGPGGGGFLGRRSFFAKDNVRAAGRTTSFTDLENRIIRPTFNEPRIHFALNCASDSCPPLHNKAFAAGNLEATLDRLTRNFLDGDPDGVSVKGGTAYISKIFDWYAGDFEAAGGARSYINRFRREPIPRKVKFQDYKWKLNSAS